MGIIDDNLLNEIAWKSLRDCYLPTFRDQVLRDQGEEFFRSRAHYHTGILNAAFALLATKGYVLMQTGVDREGEIRTEVIPPEAYAKTVGADEEEFADLC